MPTSEYEAMTSWALMTHATFSQQPNSVNLSGMLSGTQVTRTEVDWEATWRLEEERAARDPDRFHYEPWACPSNLAACRGPHTHANHWRLRSSARAWCPNGESCEGCEMHLPPQPAYTLNCDHTAQLARAEDFLRIRHLPAGDELDAAIDDDLRCWNPKRLRQKRPIGKQYSRNYPAAFSALSTWANNYPHAELSISRTRGGYCVTGSLDDPNGDWECEGRAPTLPLAICRMILHYR